MCISFVLGGGSIGLEGIWNGKFGARAMDLMECFWRAIGAMVGHDTTTTARAAQIALCTYINARRGEQLKKGERGRVM